MKEIITTLVLLLFVNLHYVSAQDIDVYKRNLNDRFDIPQIPDSMTIDEFKLLSTNLRLMDAMESMIVPGLIHFKVKDKTSGWILVGTRLIGYGGLLYVNFHKNGLWSDVLNYQVQNSSESKTDYYIALTSIGLVAGSYLYDWIHGRSLLEKKQQNIRFKYAVKLQKKVSNLTINSPRMYPELAVSINF